MFTMHVDGPKVVVETAAKRGKMVCITTPARLLAPNAYPTGAEELADRLQTVIEGAQRASCTPLHPRWF